MNGSRRGEYNDEIVADQFIWDKLRHFVIFVRGGFEVRLKIITQISCCHVAKGAERIRGDTERAKLYFCSN